MCTSIARTCSLSVECVSMKDLQVCLFCWIRIRQTDNAPWDLIRVQIQDPWITNRSLYVLHALMHWDNRCQSEGIYRWYYHSNHYLISPHNWHLQDIGRCCQTIKRFSDCVNDINLSFCSTDSELIHKHRHMRGTLEIEIEFTLQI